MDTLFINGNVQTLDDAAMGYQAVAVTNGLVTMLGSNYDLIGDVGPKTEVVDLRGSTMFLGFVDAHSHPMHHGYLLRGLDLAAPKVKRKDDILRLIKEKAERTSAGSWIVGSGYAEYNLAENRHPTRHDLDRVSPDHPVILNNVSLNA